jgi:hypothetical protein
VTLTIRTQLPGDVRTVTVASFMEMLLHLTSLFSYFSTFGTFDQVRGSSYCRPL